MNITHEILQLSYLEHFKAAKDLSLVFAPEHPQRIKLQNEIDNILAKIKDLKIENPL